MAKNSSPSVKTSSPRTKAAKLPNTERLDEASVAAFADHEILTPKRNLKSYARPAKIRVDEFGFDMEAIERAEAALAELSGEFDDWMAAEVERLTAAREAVAARGIDADTRRAVYTASHDIRGEAATFGYPLAARIAESLCDLLDGIDRHERVPAGLVVQHADAIRAIVREQAKNADHPVGSALAETLAEATAQALVAFEGSPSIVP